MEGEKAKVKIYIDGANIFYTQKKLGWSFDWVKIKKFIDEQKEVIEWRYYVATKEEDEKMASYLKYLNVIGFSSFTKPLKKIKDGERIFYKANFDVEMAIDMITDKSRVDEIMLFSGDSDFRYLVKKLKDTGKRVTIISSKKTISWELKLEAAHIIYFEKIRETIERK